MKAFLTSVAVIVVAAIVLAVIGIEEDGKLSDSGIIPAVLDSIPSNTHYEEVTYDTGTYSGDLTDEGTRQGKGTFAWTNGDKYVGEWADGEAHGHGVWTFSEPEEQAAGLYYPKKYTGTFRAGKYHGSGRLEHWNGAVYVGGFSEGKKHGKGTWTLADGSTLDLEYVYDVEQTP